MASSKANNFSAESTSLYVARNIVGLNGTHYENGLFSSSFSEIFDKKLRLFSDNSKFGEDEPFVPSKEIEAQTIGDLLPDDDDLLSDAINDTGYGARVRGTDDTDDDIFCSGGGIELEADDNFIHSRTLGYVGGEIEAPNVKQWDLNSQFSGEHSNCGHPARTLFVRNIVSNVEDSELRALFEQFGDIQTLNSSCKHRGFVMISYFDIRAACNALRSLQNKPLRHRKLDIHFSIAMENSSEKDTNQGALAVFNIDSSVSNDDIRKKFGIYGEIKEICENPHKHPHKIIEFYDIRATEAALRALNRNDIAGDKTKTDRSQSGAARWCFMQQLPPELEQEEPRGHRQGIRTYNSPSGYYGSIENDLIKSNGFDKGAVQGLHSFSVPRNLASTVRVASAGNQINHGELSQSLGQMKVDFQHMPAFHPHSVPEYHDNIVNGMPYNSTSTIPSMATNPDGFRHIHKLGSGHLNKHSENNEAGFGGPSNGSFPLNDHQYIWSTGNAYHRQSPGPMIWPKSPAFMNSIPARPLLQMHGLPGASPHMLNPVLPLPNHHVGSAPVMNPSLWDNQQDLSALHPFSMGNMRVSCNSPMHPVEFASHGGIFPRSGANCIDPAHGTIPSSRDRSYTFRGRNTEVSPSFDAPNDRLRNRRSVASASQLDVKGQYELDIGRIIRGDDSRTTLMIKNIPNKYTSKMLLATIDEHNRGTYDFIYLPIDFKNKCNVGYAFINMIHPQHIVPFHQAFNGKKWEKFNSEKVASLAYARIQGKTALIAHFQNSSLMNEDKRCRPILFHSDGPNAGDQEPFPVGDNIRTRPSRSRTAGNEENHQESPLTSPKGEDNFI